MPRVKGCTNEECESRRKNVKYKETMNFCPQCGSELRPVCKSGKCKTFLDEGDHVLCATCRAKRDDRFDKAKAKLAGTCATTVMAAGVALTKGKDILAFAARLAKK